MIVRGDAQTLPSELNKAATGEVWFDPIVPKTDGVDIGTFVFSPNGRTVWHENEHGQLLQITADYGFVFKEGRPHSGCTRASRSGSRRTSSTGTAPQAAR